MLVLDLVVSSDLECRDLITATRFAELMISSPFISPWQDRFDFLFWSCRQMDADAVTDYDV